jgi:hypothetical protein
MLTMPDLTDARYLNEFAGFCTREKYGANYFGHSNAERSRICANVIGRSASLLWSRLEVAGRQDGRQRRLRLQ